MIWTCQGGNPPSGGTGIWRTWEWSVSELCSGGILEHQVQVAGPGWLGSRLGCSLNTTMVSGEGTKPLLGWSKDTVPAQGHQQSCHHPKPCVHHAAVCSLPGPLLPSSRAALARHGSGLTRAQQPLGPPACTLSSSPAANTAARGRAGALLCRVGTAVAPITLITWSPGRPFLQAGDIQLQPKCQGAEETSCCPGTQMTRLGHGDGL